jgi:hypothetical protein
LPEPCTEIENALKQGNYGIVETFAQTIENINLAEIARQLRIL